MVWYFIRIKYSWKSKLRIKTYQQSSKRAFDNKRKKGSPWSKNIKQKQRVINGIAEVIKQQLSVNTW